MRNRQGKRRLDPNLVALAGLSLGNGASLGTSFGAEHTSRPGAQRHVPHHGIPGAEPPRDADDGGTVSVPAQDSRAENSRTEQDDYDPDDSRRIAGPLGRPLSPAVDVRPVLRNLGYEAIRTMRRSSSRPRPSKQQLERQAASYLPVPMTRLIRNNLRAGSRQVPTVSVGSAPLGGMRSHMLEGKCI